MTYDHWKSTDPADSQDDGTTEPDQNEDDWQQFWRWTAHCQNYMRRNGLARLCFRDYQAVMREWKQTTNQPIQSKETHQ